jgi:dimethylhistidine N-methyltransferase/ergothioneine biosynthesis protein EgtC
MCRHLAYLGPPRTLAEVVTAPPHGLYQQAWAPRRQAHGTVNADGFGIGWYPEGTDEPARYRRAVPIWADPNLPELARTIRSGAVLAAVRDATEGTGPEESAAAPFRDGPWLFSHNGAVPEWTRLPAALGTEAPDAATLLSLEGRCDSALLWALTVRRLRHGQPAGAALADTVRRTAAVRPTARLNLLLTDGRSIAATRWGDTLWYRAAPGEVLVASEPDDNPIDATDAGNGGWQEVPEHSLLLAVPGRVQILPLRATTPLGRETHMHDTEQQHGLTERFTLDRRLPPDHHATTLRTDVEAGLTAREKWLPPKWFYDARGSELFEQITRLPEYYPTRAEQQILTRRAPEIAARTRARTLAELGSGSSRKTRLLLDALSEAGTLLRYAPLDVSESALRQAGEALIQDYPGLRVTATLADFETELALSAQAEGPRLLAFLGGTLGNLGTEQRAAFYNRLRHALSADDFLLIGADLVKDTDVLVRAYDDSQGVTAAFNKNVLRVLNRELDADFDLSAFEHRALWNAEQDRIEMHLRSARRQTVKFPPLDLTVDFAAGEELCTEISIKFRKEPLIAELAEGGLTVREWWTDEEGRFALLLAVPSR